MNTVLFGQDRQVRIRAFLLLYPYSTTSLFQRVFFSFPSGERKCRKILADMAATGLVKRFMYGEYLYYIGKRSKQWRHQHSMTKFHFDLFFSLKKPQEIIYRKVEYVYPQGRADALYILKLHDDGRGVKFFLEWDDGLNEFDKIPKYESYAQSREWVREFWADPLKQGKYTFPQVLIVSERQIDISSDVLSVKLCKPGENYLEVLTNGNRQVSHR